MGRLVVFREVWQYLLQRKKFWLIPVMMILLAIGAIVVVSAGSSFAPLIYAMF